MSHTTFGIAAMNISTYAAAKRQAINTISDGQPQVQSSAAPVSTQTIATASPVSQISDGQPQAPTMVVAASSSAIQTMATMAPISQITDGQIQAPTTTYMPISVISDGQPQASVIPTGTSTAAAASQISDGQPQATTASASAVSTISDGQPQAATASSSDATASSTAPATKLVACKTNSTLEISLGNGVLTDSQGRTGYIAANYQFQFDKPPQAGAIYTSGWSVCGNGSLALGGSNVFYQCRSGNFYNLYDRYWAPQCSPITIESLTLINCA